MDQSADDTSTNTLQVILQSWPNARRSKNFLHINAKESPVRTILAFFMVGHLADVVTANIMQVTSLA